jgi:hypothetical protein
VFRDPKFPQKRGNGEICSVLFYKFYLKTILIIWGHGTKLHTQSFGNLDPKDLMGMHSNSNEFLIQVLILWENPPSPRTLINALEIEFIVKKNSK